MKIGIGITTFNRDKHLHLCLSQINANTGDYVLHVANDNIDRKGVAYRKNQCLEALKDCDYIFLFDDDCFPIKKGWVEYFIRQHKLTSEHHFLYLKETGSIKKINTVDGIDWFDNCGGCFMFLTKEVVEKVGGFSKEYGIYGFEHAGYSERIYKAGLTKHPYISPVGVSEYIYSLDYDNYLDFDIEHSSSVGIEAVKFIKENFEAYKKDVNNIYQQL